MDVDLMLEYLDYVDGWMLLNYEQQEIIQNSLIVLQDQGKFHQMFFWGKIFGIVKDYYIAFGLRKHVFDRVFYYSQNCVDWVLVPNPVSHPNAFTLSLDCKYRFSGNPMTITQVEDIRIEYENRSKSEELESLLQPLVSDRGVKIEKAEKRYDVKTDGKWSISSTESVLSKSSFKDNDRLLKEEDRLAAVVHYITEEAFVLPRGALFKIPNKSGLVVFNHYFRGLKETEAEGFENYVHFREPRNDWKTNLLKTSAQNYSTDFLDSADKDIPKLQWNIRFTSSRRTSIVRSLLWPGTHFFHVLETPRYGTCYFGTGLKNFDLLFMLPS